MSKLPDLIDCVPHLNGGYLKDVLAKYKYIVRINARNMNLIDLRLIEAWCKEHFGELNECSDTGSWNISIDEVWPTGILKRDLCFHFHNEQFAMAFKLRWV